MALVLQNNLLEDMLDNEEQLSEQMDALPYLVGARPAWCTALDRHGCTAGCRSELVYLLSRLACERFCDPHGPCGLSRGAPLRNARALGME